MVRGVPNLHQRVVKGAPEGVPEGCTKLAPTAGERCTKLWSNGGHRDASNVTSVVPSPQWRIVYWEDASAQLIQNSLQNYRFSHWNVEILASKHVFSITIIDHWSGFGRGYSVDQTYQESKYDTVILKIYPKCCRRHNSPRNHQ